MQRIRLAALAATASLLAACGGDSSSTGPDNPPPPPTPAPVATVVLAPATAEITIGHSRTLAATPRDSLGHTLTGRTLTWSTSAGTIAAVSTTGVVTGVAAGSATITVTAEGKTATAAITVKPASVGSIVIGPESPVVKLGETIALTASVRDDSGSVLTGRQVRWTSSAPAIASVDSLAGLVTGMASGNATITANSEGVSAQTSVSVHVPVATVTVAPALDTVEAYEPRTMAAILRDAKNNVLTGRVVRWTSSNPAVATIDSITGELMGVDRGTVTVTATSETKTGTASRVIVIKYRSLAAGSMHACDIASGGFVWCWGLNGRDGRIGGATLGDEAMSSEPVLVPNSGYTALRFTQLSSYGTSTCGITTDKRAYCWGSNSWGQLGASSSASQSNVPVAVAGGLQFRQISNGADHVCGVTVDDRAYCWGHNDGRQFASNTPGMSTAPVAVAPERSFASITAGTSYTCAVTTSGAGYCWGASGLGQLGNGSKISYGNTYSIAPLAVATSSALRSIDASLSFACAVTTGNQALCWGSDGGRLGSGNIGDTSTPRAVSGGLAFASLSAGNGFACGVTTGGAVWCWGSNTNGQLGVSSLAVATSPVRAGGSLLAAEVSASGVSTGFGRHTCAISADRLTTYCFGRNDVGQLGNGRTTDATAVNATPSVVAGQTPLP